MKKIKLNLVGLDGNAFSLMGAFSQQAKREGWTKEEISAVIDEAKSSDYQHLLRTLAERCDPSKITRGEDCDFCGEPLGYCECEEEEDFAAWCAPRSSEDEEDF